MASFKSWIKAFRLRTLPLALSVILTGSFLAIQDGVCNWWIIGLSLLTTLFLQVLSNLANDYGDSLKGTDNNERVGPRRTVQSGEISRESMKKAIIIFASLSLLSGVALLYFSFGDNFKLSLLFLIMGLASIWAAVKYTVGDNAYGYFGLGDLFVFVFFGLVGVVGSYFLNTHALSAEVFLPASAMGLFSAGVLNLNNMRDIDNDIRSGKHTMASRLGIVDAKKYHLTLIIIGWILLLVWMMLQKHHPERLILLVALPFFLFDLFKVLHTKEKPALDPYLRKLALKTLLIALLFGVSILL
ncbi:MAG: 1,4-dihydroxy-2-naphthoate octaprenyltransferase [Bacteroidetes bacterium]|nr:MAG: 1,4-dihydroxy-2-naphthoate octaprenyltransferase [Bacteroidota bacterium]